MRGIQIRFIGSNCHRIVRGISRSQFHAAAALAQQKPPKNPSDTPTTTDASQLRSNTNTHSARTRLTNFLWADRFAQGSVDQRPPGPNQQPSAPTHPSISPENLKPRRMLDSYCQVILPFRTDLAMREEYVNFYRGLRLGKILEDLDALAASVAHKHCGDTIKSRDPVTGRTTFNYSIVTASMDRMDLLNPLRPDLDLKLHGHVTYVGNSSLEVTLRVESLGDPKSHAPIDESGMPLESANADWTPICICKFTMVAKDPVTQKAVRVNPLVLETDHEKQLFAMGEENKRVKLEAAQVDLLKQPPTVDERIVIHQLWLEQQKYSNSQGQVEPEKVPDNIKFMDQTVMESVELAHPQERNIHFSVFGGFLMREAFELAYTNAAAFLRGRPYTVSMDDVTFRRPVPIGSVLYFTSHVVYAEGHPRRSFQVGVVAEVVSNIRTMERSVSNVFYFTFAAGDQEMDGGVAHVPRLMPCTYGESMIYLQGIRRKQRSLKARKSQMKQIQRTPLSASQPVGENK